MLRPRLLRSVSDMENLINALTNAAEFSVIIFGVMVITAMALASVSTYVRGRRRHL